MGTRCPQADGCGGGRAMMVSYCRHVAIVWSMYALFSLVMVCLLG